MLGEDFSRGCKLLADKVNESCFAPDLVIGVLTGGGYVGREVYKNIHSDTTIYKEIKLQRGSTKTKKKLQMEKILSKLSYSILNWMRIMEVKLLEQKSKIVKPKRYGNVTFDHETENMLRKGNKKILIIDDCIDTGMTLKIIKDIIIKKFGKTLDIKIAVITIAHNHPVIRPDYYLYDRVLIRFPWALDAKI